MIGRRQFLQWVGGILGYGVLHTVLPSTEGVRCTEPACTEDGTDTSNDYTYLTITYDGNVSKYILVEREFKWSTT